MNSTIRSEGLTLALGGTGEIALPAGEVGEPFVDAAAMAAALLYTLGLTQNGGTG